MSDERLRAEAVRVYLRYAIEVVEALNLCPWARRARLDGRTRTLVVVAADPHVEDVLPCIDEVAVDPGLDIGLVLFPRLAIDRAGFHRFVARVRERDAQRHPPGRTPMLMADFHPVAEPDATSPARLVSFIRRTPDPTIQLVRRTTLDAERRGRDEGTICQADAILVSLAVAAGLPKSELASAASAAALALPLHERVAIANRAAVERHGVDRVRAVLDDIRRDRDQAYALSG